MEKMEKMKSIVQARSDHEGITFFSSVNPNLGIKAYRGTDNAINFRPTIGHEKPPITRQTVRRLGSFWLIINVFLAILAISTKQITIMLSSILFITFISKEFFVLLLSIFSIDRKTKKYHAAEHMVINAYIQYERIPTLEEVRNFSRFSPTCGSTYQFKKILTIFPWIIFLCISSKLTPLIIYILVWICTFVFTMLVIKTDIVKFLQIFLTSKPCDRELEVAIAGIKEWQILEKSFIFKI